MPFLARHRTICAVIDEISMKSGNPDIVRLCAEAKEYAQAMSHRLQEYKYWGYDADLKVAREKKKPAKKLKCFLRRIRLNSGGYDRSGYYFGVGQPLYYYDNENCNDYRASGNIRASTRDAAKEQIRLLFPNVEFYR